MHWPALTRSEALYPCCYPLVAIAFCEQCHQCCWRRAQGMPNNSRGTRPIARNSAGDSPGGPAAAGQQRTTCAAQDEPIVHPDARTRSLPGRRPWPGRLARHCCFWLLREHSGPPNHPRLGVQQQGCTAVIPGEAGTYTSAPCAQQPTWCQGCQAPHITRLQTAIVSEERTLATSAS